MDWLGVSDNSRRLSICDIAELAETDYDDAVHGSARDLEVTRTRAHRVDGAPWAVALNATAASDDISLTLLALAVVDDVIHISGVVRVSGRAEVRLSSIPNLRLASVDGPPLELIRAHGLPGGAMVWVSWTYKRPPVVRRQYEARVEQIDLVYRAGRVVNESAPGPWIFVFSVRDDEPFEAVAPGFLWNGAPR